MSIMLHLDAEYQANPLPPVTTAELFNMPFYKISDIFYPSESFFSPRTSTGAYLFLDSLYKNIKYDYAAVDIEQLAEYPEVIVEHYLHCIQWWEQTEHFTVKFVKKCLERGIKVVNFSVGFWFDENRQFDMCKELRYIFSQMAERAEIGVRGERSADLLNRNGIKNVRVIGCPSMYYHMNRDFKVTRYKSLNKVKNLNANLTINQGYYVPAYKPVMQYFLKLYHSGTVKIHHTLQEGFLQEISKRMSYEHFRDFYIGKFQSKQYQIDCGRYFFDVDNWIQAVAKDDFSLGTKFHGNIAAVLANTPALFLIVDERMRELSDYYKFPSIECKDFDPSKPLEYYYELADYSEFNKNYVKTYDNFIDYCEKNSVRLNNK